MTSDRDYQKVERHSLLKWPFSVPCEIYPRAEPCRRCSVAALPRLIDIYELTPFWHCDHCRRPSNAELLTPIQSLRNEIASSDSCSSRCAASDSARGGEAVFTAVQCRCLEVSP